jgi:glutathione S-transferase
MFAPVVSRLHTYDIGVGPVAHQYMEAIMALPAWSEWHAAAERETWVMPGNELD